MSAKVINVRDQLTASGMLVFDVQARVSRSNDAVIVLVTLGTPQHQRTLAASEHFVSKTINEGRISRINVAVFWRYQLPTSQSKNKST